MMEVGGEGGPKYVYPELTHISLWGKKIQFMYSDRVTDITRTAREGP